MNEMVRVWTVYSNDCDLEWLMWKQYEVKIYYIYKDVCANNSKAHKNVFKLSKCKVLIIYAATQQKSWIHSLLFINC